MQKKLAKVEDLYSRLFELSKQIEELLEKEIHSELVTYINKKKSLLQEANCIIQTIDKNQVDTKNLETIVKKYAQQEKINLEKLSSIKTNLKKELTQTTKNSKLLNAYKDDKEYMYGSILDFFE